MPVTFADQVSPEIPTKPRKPKNTSFRQQRVGAWEPIYTVGFVVPTFLVIGIAFIPIGIGMLSISNNIMEKVIPYTDCTNKEGRFCKNVIASQRPAERDCFCNISFEVDTDWKGDVFIFYSLTNFYQNHRRYLRSRNDHQLLGNLDYDDWGNTDDCDPYTYCEDSSSCCNGANGTGRCDYELKTGTPYMPCGAIANSMYSDIIKLR